VGRRPCRQHRLQVHASLLLTFVRKKNKNMKLLPKLIFLFSFLQIIFFLSLGDSSYLVADKPATRWQLERNDP
jgi:hypothetical protein